MSLTRPLGAGTSDRSREREARLRQTREEVRTRAGTLCEWPLCYARGTDLAHGFRRGNRVGTPLCDHPALCLWLCRKHHDTFDGRTAGTYAEVSELEEQMAGRALAAYGYTWRDVGHDASVDCNFWISPIDAVRELERTLRAEGRL